MKNKLSNILCILWWLLSIIIILSFLFKFPINLIERKPLGNDTILYNTLDNLKNKTTEFGKISTHKYSISELVEIYGFENKDKLCEDYIHNLSWFNVPKKLLIKYYEKDSNCLVYNAEKDTIINEFTISSSEIINTYQQYVAKNNRQMEILKDENVYTLKTIIDNRKYLKIPDVSSYNKSLPERKQNWEISISYIKRWHDIMNTYVLWLNLKSTSELCEKYMVDNKLEYNDIEKYKKNDLIFRYDIMGAWCFVYSKEDNMIYDFLSVEIEDINHDLYEKVESENKKNLFK